MSRSKGNKKKRQQERLQARLQTPINGSEEVIPSETNSDNSLSPLPGFTDQNKPQSATNSKLSQEVTSENTQQAPASSHVITLESKSTSMDKTTDVACNEKEQPPLTMAPKKDEIKEEPRIPKNVTNGTELPLTTRNVMVLNKELKGISAIETATAEQYPSPVAQKDISNIHESTLPNQKNQPPVNKNALNGSNTITSKKAVDSNRTDPEADSTRTCCIVQ